MEGAQALKRIPRIKFPQRHPKSSSGNDSAGSTLQQQQEASKVGNADQTFLSSSGVSTTVGGKASMQPKRTPISNEEIETILLGGCI